MASRVCISLVTYTDINNIIKQKIIHIIFFYKIKIQIISNGVVHEYLSSHRTLLHVMQVWIYLYILMKGKGGNLVILEIDSQEYLKLNIFSIILKSMST